MANETDNVSDAALNTPEAVMATLRLGGGVKDGERELIEATLIQLANRLARLNPSSVEMELSVKDGGKKGQKTTLELWLPHTSKLVGTSELEQLKDALNEAETALLAQISSLSKHSPANKQNRETIRG